MATLELRNVNKTYGTGVPDTLKDIQLAIKDGEFLILVGPSGCGKSTLMNCIAGLESISGGAILIDGDDVSGMSPKDRDIAMVFQSYALYPTMSVRDNIAFGLKIRKLPQAAIDEEVARVAKLLQIEHLLTRKPGQLSGGQQQRVAMGRALARRPKIYLFDEPLSNLDAKLRVEMRTEIKLMHQRLKTTTVYVTHDQIEAMTLGDKVAVMKDGIIQQFGTPQQIYNDPANQFVASFIGSPPMNLLRHAPGVRPGQILGVRPEHLKLDPAGWVVQVEYVELLGAERLVYGHIGEEPVIVRIDEAETPPRAGDTVHVGAPPERLHAFDAGSGKRVD